MAFSEIVSQIDHQIAMLRQARALLAGTQTTRSAASAAPKKKSAKKRNLTPEGRKRIAEAVRRRWAEQKKSAATK